MVLVCFNVSGGQLGGVPFRVVQEELPGGALKVTLEGALDIGDSVHWSAVQAPEGIRPVITDRDFTIASVAAPTKMAEVAATAEAPLASAVPSAKGGDKPAAAAPAAGAKPAAKK